MTPLSRRQFVRAAAVGTAGLSPLPAALHADEPRQVRSAPANRSPLRITNIETHDILPPFHDFNAATLLHYQGVGRQYRTVFIVKTDNGLEGYGETWGRARPKNEEHSKYIGTDPFDWVGDTSNLPLNMAMYDLMGKHLGLPAWKLLGPKARSWAAVACWTVSQPPEAMAEEVRQAARRGYHWLKYHVDELQNAIDQTRAMDKIAPRGFKVHYDFNSNSTYEAVYPVLRELQRFPVAGRIEDPLNLNDREGWRMLRQKCGLPILGENASVEFMLEHLCDAYISSHKPVGQAAKVAAVAESLNMPLLIQQTGGTINQAFLVHEAAAFKAATLEHVTLCHLWKDDVTTETMPVVGGSVAVPKGPGLGVTLDREKLERYKKASPPKQNRFLVRARYADGLQIYFRYDPNQRGALDKFMYLSHQNVPGPAPSYANPVVTDFWDEDDSAEFQRLWKQTEEGPVAINGR